MIYAFLNVIDRFGEESLHSCEVMLKDVEDSKRANNAIFSELSRRAPQVQAWLGLIPDARSF
jgi:hypothetical protein